MNKMSLLKAMNDINDDFIEEAALSNNNSNVVLLNRRKSIKRYIGTISGVAAAIVLIVSIGVVRHNDNPEEHVQVVNPYVYCESLDEAKSITGFGIAAPEILLDKSLDSIIVVAGDTIELDYGNDDNMISIRKAKGSEDISGDYNTYEIEETISDGDIEITVKGNEKINLILWTNDDYTYAVSLPEGVDEDAIMEIVNSIK